MSRLFLRTNSPNGSTLSSILMRWMTCRRVDRLAMWLHTAISSMRVSDDTLPGGPRTVERRSVAPAARVNREDDYCTAFAFFEGTSE